VRKFEDMTTHERDRQTDERTNEYVTYEYYFVCLFVVSLTAILLVHEVA